MSNHLKVDELDLAEIVMALEEEFDIEIPDESVDLYFSIGTFNWSSGSSSILSYSSFNAGEECTVRNFVEFIYKTTSNY
jgi:hypothetical protein